VGLGLSASEQEELARLEASGDAFERLVELAKAGGVDIPPPSAASAMCGPTSVSVDSPSDGSIPGLPAGLTKPPWLRQRAPAGDKYKQISDDVRGLGLATVCEEAMCPNLGECWNGDTGTADDHDHGRHVHARLPFLRGEHQPKPPRRLIRTNRRTPPTRSRSGASGTSC
jgi:hypothetical protein